MGRRVIVMERESERWREGVKMEDDECVSGGVCESGRRGEREGACVSE